MVENELLAINYNSLRDSLFSTAQAAGLAPKKEVRALLPGTDLRPADILIPRWTAGRDTALNVTVIHLFQLELWNRKV